MKRKELTDKQEKAVEARAKYCHKAIIKYSQKHLYRGQQKPVDPLSLDFLRDAFRTQALYSSSQDMRENKTTQIRRKVTKMGVSVNGEIYYSPEFLRHIGEEAIIENLPSGNMKVITAEGNIYASFFDMEKNKEK